MLMDRRWFPMRYVSRDDATGEWVQHDAPPAPEASVKEQPSGGGATIAAVTGKVEKVLAPSLVQVSCHWPYGVGVAGDAFLGTGTIIDADKGLVLVDRMTAPTALGDFTLNFFDSIQVPGKVVAIHPIHNLAVIQYDPALIGDTPVKAAKIAKERPKRGDKAWLVGMSGSSRQGASRALRACGWDPQCPRVLRM